MSPIDALPPALHVILDGAAFAPVAIGMSGAQVWRVEVASGPTRYLKSASGPRVYELRAERDRLRWLAGRLSVPEVFGWEEEAGSAWLLLSEARGVMACDDDMMRDPARVVALLAEGLRAIHALPVDGCPFVVPLDERLRLAAANIRQGLVDEADVRAGNGVSPMELLRRLRAERPDEPGADRVFTHGDYCLPNVLLAPNRSRVTAYLDWGRAAVADRYQDVAIGARSVRYNLGPEWERAFLAAYGLTAPDPERFAYYELLDELF